MKREAIMSEAVKVLKNESSSPCGKYRYWLSREWDNTLATMLMIGLHPSKCDYTEDTRTVNKCVAIAKNNGCGRLFIANVFPLKVKKGKKPDRYELRRETAVVAETNKQIIVSLAKKSGDLIICAWGSKAGYEGTSERITRSLEVDYEINCLGLTNSGFPKRVNNVEITQSLFRYNSNPPTLRYIRELARLRFTHPTITDLQLAQVAAYTLKGCRWYGYESETGTATMVSSRGGIDISSEGIVSENPHEFPSFRP